MTGRERCDEILRLIDQALAEVELTVGAQLNVAPRRRAGRAAERVAETVSP